MSDGILLARSGAMLMTCLVCKKPAPPDHMAPVNPKEGLCLGCWGKAAMLRGWTRDTAFPNGVPVLTVHQFLLQGLQREGARDENPIRTLVRVLHEYRQFCLLADTPRTDATDRLLAPVCCYCGDAEREGEANLIELEGKPPIWQCQEFEACDARLYDRIMGMLMKELAAARNGQ